MESKNQNKQNKNKLIDTKNKGVPGASGEGRKVRSKIGKKD